MHQIPSLGTKPTFKDTLHISSSAPKTSLSLSSCHQNSHMSYTKSFSFHHKKCVDSFPENKIQPQNFPSTYTTISSSPAGLLPIPEKEESRPVSRPETPSPLSQHGGSGINGPLRVTVTPQSPCSSAHGSPDST